jgi:hypothetical protein
LRESLRTTLERDFERSGISSHELLADAAVILAAPQPPTPMVLPAAGPALEKKELPRVAERRERRTYLVMIALAAGVALAVLGGGIRALSGGGSSALCGGKTIPSKRVVLLEGFDGTVRAKALEPVDPPVAKPTRHVPGRGKHASR